MFAEGAFAQAFVPILAEYKETRSPEATQAFVRHVAGMLSFVLVVVTALGILAAPWVIYVSAPGFAKEADKFQLSIDLLRVTFPYIFLISLSSFVGSILNSYHKFGIPAFTPTFLNISFIVFSCFLYLISIRLLWLWRGRYLSAACCSWCSNCLGWRNWAS